MVVVAMGVANWFYKALPHHKLTVKPLQRSAFAVTSCHLYGQSCAAVHSPEPLADGRCCFGTGSHPTTRLCLEAIEALADQAGGSLGPIRVADLGCGSGILGLAALLQGAARVTAVDTDCLAVRATQDNAALSGCSDRLQVGLGSAQTLAALLEGQPADLLLCNILAPVIEALSPTFHTLLDATGVGLLSGLLVDQAPDLEQALLEQGWRAQLTAQQGLWGLMTIRRVA